jgi:hypothetical protein
MAADRALYPSSSSRVGVSWSDGVVRLRDDELFGTRVADLTLLHGNDCIKVGDLGPRARGQAKEHEHNGLDRNQAIAPNSLMVGINGRVAGLIHFRRSERPEAAAALLRLRSRPNLTCVAGAFAWGFTSLASVLVTNLGTYSVYSRTAASIRNLERQIARSPERRPSSALGIS